MTTKTATTVEHSPQFDHLKERYDHKRISISMLRKYVLGGRITKEEFKEITGEDAPVVTE